MTLILSRYLYRFFCHLMDNWTVWVLLLTIAGVWSTGMQPANGQEADTLSLEEAVATALQQNQSVRIQEREAMMAANNYAVGNAGFLPTFSLQAQQNRQPGGTFFGAGSNQPPGTSVGGALGTFSSSVNASWTVFDGMRRFAVYDQLEAAQNEATVRAEGARENVVADVIVRYYNVALQQQQVDVQAEAVELSEERLRIAELRYDLGSASELDVRQARIDLNQDRAAYLEQQSSLRTAQAELNRVLGRTAPLDLLVSEETEFSLEFDLDQLMASASEENRALRAARHVQTELNLEQRVVRAERLPRIDVTAGYVFNDMVSEIGVPTLQPGGFSYGFTATVDLFDGYSRQRRLDNADLQQQRQAFVIDELETDIMALLQYEKETFKNSLMRAELEQENLEAARLNVEVALERFRLGTITSIELREVQRTLTNIENRYLSAQYEAKEAETTLLLVSGQLLERWR